MEFLFYVGFFVVGGVLGHLSKEWVAAKMGKPAKKARKARAKKAKPEDAAPLA